MKLDREKLKQLIELSDEELWKTVVEIGRSHGFILPDKTPPHTEIEKLREIARDGTRLNVANAIKIFNKYRGS